MRTSFLFVLLLLGACSSDDTKLCDCIEAGEYVNELSASFFHREYSDLGKDSLDQAVLRRDELCQEFINMSADELQSLTSNCEQLKVRLD